MCFTVDIRTYKNQQLIGVNYFTPFTFFRFQRFHVSSNSGVFIKCKKVSYQRNCGSDVRPAVADRDPRAGRGVPPGGAGPRAGVAAPAPARGPGLRRGRRPSRHEPRAVRHRLVAAEPSSISFFYPSFSYCTAYPGPCRRGCGRGP